MHKKNDFLTFWNDVEILNQVKTIKISTDGKMEGFYTELR